MENLSALIQPFTLVLSRMAPLFLSLSMSPVARFPGMVRLILLLVLSIALTNLAITEWLPLSNTDWAINLLMELGLGTLMMLSFHLTYA